MLPAIVLVAEGLVVLWFAVFIGMMVSMYLDSRSMPAAATPRCGGANVDWQRQTRLCSRNDRIGGTDLL
jgi:hypothetical protein